MEDLREILHNAINENGLDYEKIIEIDTKLHKEIIKQQLEMMKKTK